MGFRTDSGLFRTRFTVEIDTPEMGYDGPVGLEAFARDKEEDALHAFRAAFTL